jgi:plastocyanin
MALAGLGVGSLFVLGSVPVVVGLPHAAGETHVKKVVVPGEDRFSPFAVTIEVGNSVQWTNMDTDNHRVVSDDAFTTAGHKGTDHLIVGTAHGGPGKFTLKFDHAGTFVYYCRLHAHLDPNGEPSSGGMDGTGIPGTPMMGIVTVER